MKKGDKAVQESGVKRPNSIKEIVIPSQSDSFGDTLLMVSLIFGMGAILLKVRGPEGWHTCLSSLPPYFSFVVPNFVLVITTISCGIVGKYVRRRRGDACFLFRLPWCLGALPIWI